MSCIGLASHYIQRLLLLFKFFLKHHACPLGQVSTLCQLLPIKKARDQVASQSISLNAFKDLQLLLSLMRDRCYSVI